MHAGYEEKLRDMKERKEFLKGQKQGVKKRMVVVTGIIFIGISIPLLLRYLFPVGQEGIPPIVISFYLATYLIILVISYSLARTRERLFDEAIQDLDFEIDLMQFKVSEREGRAEKLLRINNIQLRRYYDLNLSQNIWVFGLGIFCIFLGLAAIGVTFYLVLKETTDDQAKIIVAIVGSVGSILVNYIGAIYLKMHASASANLAGFHTRLVETSQTLLGNLLASRIENENKRWDTLSQLSIELVKK